MIPRDDDEIQANTPGDQAHEPQPVRATLDLSTQEAIDAANRFGAAPGEILSQDVRDTMAPSATSPPQT